jgi:hypothetical protein
MAAAVGDETSARATLLTGDMIDYRGRSMIDDLSNELRSALERRQVLEQKVVALTGELQERNEKVCAARTGAHCAGYIVASTRRRLGTRNLVGKGKVGLNGLKSCV